MKSSVKVVTPILLTSNSCKKLTKHHHHHRRNGNNNILHDSDAYLFQDYKCTTTNKYDGMMKEGCGKSDGSNMTYYTRSSSGGYSSCRGGSSHVQEEGEGGGDVIGSSESVAVASSYNEEEESSFSKGRKGSIDPPGQDDDEESYISGCNDDDDSSSDINSDSDYCDSNISTKRNVPSTQDKMLVELLQENEMLRESINSIRIDFEKMLHQIQHDDNDRLGLGDSISTCTDNSGISNCLRQIEYVKIQTMERMRSLLEGGKFLENKDKEEDGKNDNDYASKEEKQLHQDLLDSSSSSGEDQCVVDLLREENERLCKFVCVYIFWPLLYYRFLHVGFDFTRVFFVCVSPLFLIPFFSSLFLQ